MRGSVFFMKCDIMIDNQLIAERSEEKRYYSRASCDRGAIGSEQILQESIMIYKEFKGKQLSQLGFGAMRLPLLEDGSIDEPQVEQMVDYAIENGVNFFDTAYPYHSGESEEVMGRVLSRYPRESFYLATKYPGHQFSESYDPAAVFEEQLKKCQVEYFDFYLMHNICEYSLNTYLDDRWNIVPYFIQQKKAGRIKHLGFSSHGTIEVMQQFLDAFGDEMEFCLVQANYLDWTLQDAKSKVEFLNENELAIMIMEPLRGGKLARLTDAEEAEMKAMRPDESVPAWSFRFLQEVDGVSVILSGMSSFDQMVDNVRTFKERKPLSDREKDLVFRVAEGLKDSVPCTGCRYCIKDCPMGLDIPLLLEIYNEMRILPGFNPVLRVEGMPEDKKPSVCIACGKCSDNCPQNIDIPGSLADLTERLASMPSWESICIEREAAQKKRTQAAQ